MNVHIRLSAGLASAAGSSRLVVTLAEEATVADLLDHLRTEYPALASKIERAVPVISGRHVALSESLSGTEEVALLLPISGGAR
jgi:molybdopterin converting factor small subunit